MKQCVPIIMLFAWVAHFVLAESADHPSKPKRHTVHFESEQDLLDWVDRLFPPCAVGAAPKVTLEFLQSLDPHWSEETFRRVVDLALDDSSRYALMLREGGFPIVLNHADELWKRYPWEGHAYLREQLLEWHERRGWPSNYPMDMGRLLRVAVTKEDYDLMLAFLEDGGKPPSMQYYETALYGGPASAIAGADITRLMKAWECRRVRGLDRRNPYDQAALRRVNVFWIDQAIAEVREADGPERRSEAIQSLLEQLREMVDTAAHWGEIYRPRHPWLQEYLEPWHRAWMENPPESLAHEPRMYRWVGELRWERWQKEDPRLVRALCHAILHRSDLMDAPAFAHHVDRFIRRNPHFSDLEPLSAAIRTLEKELNVDGAVKQVLLRSIRTTQRIVSEHANRQSATNSREFDSLTSEEKSLVKEEAINIFGLFRRAEQMEREERSAMPCHPRLLQIASAKGQWSLTWGIPAGHVISTDEKKRIGEYLRYGIPQCPQGGRYDFGAVGDLPSCSIHGRPGEAVSADEK